jgi:hypothetical protein
VGAARAAAAHNWAEQRKGKGRKKGEGRADRWGPGVSGCGEKRKKDGADGALREKPRWAGGPLC